MSFAAPPAVTPIALGPVVQPASLPPAIGNGAVPSSVAIGNFQASLDRAGAGASSPLANPLRGIMQAVEQIDGQARSVSNIAATASANGAEMRPGDVIDLTMRCQEFMFQCQLTSNIANRSADGVQQLFRQQG